MVGALDDEITRALERAAGRITPLSESDADVIVLGAQRATDLAGLGKLAGNVKEDGTIWVVRPEHNLARSVQAHGVAAGLTGGETVTLNDEYVGDRLDLRRDGNGSS